MPKLTPETIAELRRTYEEAMRVGSNEMAWDEWTTAISEAAEARRAWRAHLHRIDSERLTR